MRSLPILILLVAFILAMSTLGDTQARITELEKELAEWEEGMVEVVEYLEQCRDDLRALRE